MVKKKPNEVISFECKLVQPWWEPVRRFLKKLKEKKNTIGYSNFKLKEMKSVLQNDICTPMFTAGTFTITNIRKPGKCPTTDEWITNVCACVCVLSSLKCPRDPATCSKTDEPGRPAKSHKPNTKR